MSMAPEMVKRGEIDEATIGADILDSWLADDATKDLVSMGPSQHQLYLLLPVQLHALLPRVLQPDGGGPGRHL